MAREDWPQVRQLTMNDLADVIAAGIKDFRAAPRFGLVISGIYIAAGWLVVALLWRYRALYFAYPLAMGFALVAPFLAVGFYAVSDFLERGQELSWSAIIAAVRAAIRRDLRWMAGATGLALVIWMDIAAFLLFAMVGIDGVGSDFLDILVTTPRGLMFLVLGNTIGAILALIVFSFSAVSFPMLYDRDVDFVTAMVTSVRLVIANPGPMLSWAVLIGLLSAISLVSVFAGLVIVLPVIGHATWHLYRRAVAPEAAPDGAVRA